MARPRSDAAGPDACERIIEAFWEMLSEMPYPEMKVTALARKAHVSPNTLYYHFDGILDVARHALVGTMDAGLAQAMAAADAETIVSFVATNRKRSERVAAFARSGSVELTGMLADALRAHWLSSAGVSEDDLDDAPRRDLAFVIGGIVSVLGDASVDQSPESVAAFFNRPLGRGAAEMMNGLATLRAS